MKKLLIAFAAVALSAVAAETCGITFNSPSVIKGTELKAGDYKLVLTDNKVVISHGATKVEVTATVQTVDKKIGGTSITYEQQDGKRVVRSILLGGTKTKLVFDDGVRTGGGGQ